MGREILDGTRYGAGDFEMCIFVSTTDMENRFVVR